MILTITKIKQIKAIDLFSINNLTILQWIYTNPGKQLASASSNFYFYNYRLGNRGRLSKYSNSVEKVDILDCSSHTSNWRFYFHQMLEGLLSASPLSKGSESECPALHPVQRQRNKSYNNYYADSLKRVLLLLNTFRLN